MKMWICIVAIILIILGLAMIVTVLALNQWDWGVLSTMKFETNSYEFKQAISDVSVNIDTADVTFLPSEDQNIRVECQELEKVKHTVQVKNGTLVIATDDQRAWYDHIGIHIGVPKITVYLPGKSFANLTVQGSTGDITVAEIQNLHNVVLAVKTGKVQLEQFSATSLDLSVSTGGVTLQSVFCDEALSVRVTTGDSMLKDVYCGSFISNGSTGDLMMRKVITAGGFSIDRTTGDVTLEECDASDILIRTSTGDVTGSLLSDKVFFANTNTGRVDVPKSLAGGRCQINTSTGNICFEIA